jgi:hypothetical protein
MAQNYFARVTTLCQQCNSFFFIYFKSNEKPAQWSRLIKDVPVLKALQATDLAIFIKNGL